MDSPRSSRRASIASHASAAYSQAGSTRHILADMHGSSSSGDFTNDRDRALYPPINVPTPGSATPSRDASPSPCSVSLSVNYLPHKFSSTLLAPSSGEARMPGAADEDYDGVGFGGAFKWVLFLTGYSLTALIVCLLIWFNVFTHADVIRVGNHPELVLSTIAASLGLFTCLIGWSGILLNNRTFLAWYTFLLWAVLAFLINSQWSRNLGADGRLRIQNELECCGYYSPFVEATISQTCYSRAFCRGRETLRKWFTAAFALVPVHIGVILAGLLCSNHVTYRFGKGMMPEAMAVIMDNYASQLAEQYGNDVASEVINRSRSNLNLNSMQSMPYQQTQSPGGGDRYHVKYDSVGQKAPEGAM
ncbi:hypothetical protein BDQ17DRAFT_1377012 [Cyathus striatus]|nr:hypothetical protein BDQ17DRAFT_1377012 [Cyathus striatus]